MKSTLLILLMSSLFSTISLANVNSSKIYTDQGYPYKQLVNRADEVKLHFTQQKQDVKCSVKLNVNGKEVETKSLVVSNKAFNKKPLASCLSRDTAKSILATTFN